MKEVRIKFVGFWNSFKPEDTVFFKILSQYFNPVLCDDPDYVICGCFEPFYEYLKYPQVRIMICGENYTPDFNFVDYAICRYPIKFLDRCFYEPGCLRPFPACFDLKIDRNFSMDDLSKKTHFCNFISSHESEDNIRGDFFKALCKYRKVDSVGSYLNNSGFIVRRNNGTKQEFQKKCKFTLCFESTKNEGFFTEKLTDAFLSGTIPIYYGSSTAKDFFNRKAYIDVSDFPTFEDAINKIIEIDNNDELYLSMLNEPILNNKNDIERIYTEESEFIKYIFNQEYSKCYRRSRVYIPYDHEKYVLNLKKRKNKKRSFIHRVFKYLQKSNYK